MDFGNITCMKENPESPRPHFVAGDMAHLGKRLLHKRKDLSLDPQDPCSKLDAVKCICNSGTKKADTRGSLELDGQLVYPHQ